MDAMSDELSTGQVAERLGISEPRLQELIRRRKVRAPKPKNGRRKWTSKELETARDVVGRN